MSHPARSALVLQGGGALGAYELGAARALYEKDDFVPDVVAGVSIGAITAVLLARPAQGLKPLQALEAFWQKVAVPGLAFPQTLRQYASILGTYFFVPSRLLRLADMDPTFTTRRCPPHAGALVDLEALADRSADPDRW